MHPMSKYLALLLLPLSVGCQTLVSRQDADCIGFVPDSWKQPVPSAPLPDAGATDLEEAKAWQGFSVAQTVQLSKSNGRNDDLLHIFSTCERKYNEARPRKKLLGIF